jgi:glycosyltransferase involved in cell wall biosynthesis
MMPARRLRLAFFSPFNPQKSGIADYSEELLPHLGDLADIDLISGLPRLSNPSLPARFRVRSVAKFLADHAGYDAAIYQIGNNLDHHGYMVPCMRVVPGILVLHDLCLQYLMLGLTLRAGNFRALIQTLTPSYGRAAVPLATKLLLNLGDPNRLSFAGPLIDMSTAVIVHSCFARDRVAEVAPDKPTRVIPMGVPLDDEQTPFAFLRSRYGLEPDDFILASVSTLAASKRLDVALRAVHQLKRHLPRLKFLIVGGGNLGDEARAMILRYSLQDTVVITGWVVREDYRGLIALASVVLDLRYPSGAETSASLTRAMAVGRPLIVSAQGSFLELPGGCTIKVPVDAREVDGITQSVLRLAADAGLRESTGRHARAFCESNLQLKQAARAYIEFAAEVASVPEGRRHVVLWPAAETRNHMAALVSGVYKLSRVAYLYRNYGWSDTLRRIREETRRQPAWSRSDRESSNYA